MDYYKYASDGYFNVVAKFDSISNVLLKKLNQFEKNGFDPSNGFAFGFSLGGQLVINAGRDFGGKLSAVDGKIYFVSYLALKTLTNDIFLFFALYTL